MHVYIYIETVYIYIQLYIYTVYYAYCAFYTYIILKSTVCNRPSKHGSFEPCLDGSSHGILSRA